MMFDCSGALTGIAIKQGAAVGTTNAATEWRQVCRQPPPYLYQPAPASAETLVGILQWLPLPLAGKQIGISSVTGK